LNLLGKIPLFHHLNLPNHMPEVGLEGFEASGNDPPNLNDGGKIPHGKGITYLPNGLEILMNILHDRQFRHFAFQWGNYVILQELFYMLQGKILFFFHFFI
jgi:hypothetical protein